METAPDRSGQTPIRASVSAVANAGGLAATKAEVETGVAVVTTDGSCIGNPGPGGWAATVFRNDAYNEVFGSEKQTTNNRMELRAVIEGLRLLRSPSRVRVITDSQYVKSGITLWLAGWKRKGWRRPSMGRRAREVANQDLWQELDSVASRHEVQWEWVRGHSGHPGNSRCHQLAVEAARRAARHHRA
jgi:ribonuclease HI